MTKGFIKDYDLIREDCRVEDLLDFSDDIKALSSRLASIDGVATIGLVGRFGTGKSTMLYQIQKESGENEKWVNFDAWKYPERRDLWEGFVLDFADQIGDKKKVQKKIDGKQTKSKWLDIGTDIISEITDRLPPLDFLDKFVGLFKSSPATRVFEIQQILAEIIEKQKSDLYITVEDIDRSGDAGIFFLETLKQFLRELKTKKKIIAIVPIDDANFRERRASYFKCLDYVEFFDPQLKGLETFLNSALDDELFQGDYSYSGGPISSSASFRKGQITSFCEELIRLPSATIRLLKIILRNADQVFKSQESDGHKPDWRVTICFEAAKHSNPDPEKEESHFESFKRNRVIPRATLYASFLHAMANDLRSIHDFSGNEEKKQILLPLSDMKLVTRGEADDPPRFPSWPYMGHTWEEGDEEKLRPFVCDFYLNY